MNHHGKVRKLGGDDEENTEDDEATGPNVLKNNWVGGTEKLKLDLISRHEDVQVCKSSQKWIIVPTFFICRSQH